MAFTFYLRLWKNDFTISCGYLRIWCDVCRYVVSSDVVIFCLHCDCITPFSLFLVGDGLISPCYNLVSFLSRDTTPPLFKRMVFPFSKSSFFIVSPLSLTITNLGSITSVTIAPTMSMSLVIVFSISLKISPNDAASSATFAQPVEAIPGYFL